MNRSDSSLSTMSAGDRIKLEGGSYSYPVVFEDEDDEAMMDVSSDSNVKLREEDDTMFGMDDD